MSLKADLDRARNLAVDDLADTIESIGFECTRCGACCKAVDDADGDGDEHTATIFPDEVRTLQAREEYDWRDVARPMPYGLDDSGEGSEGVTFEWALQTNDCGDCRFYEEDPEGVGACTVHADRPLICRTYPFSVALDSTVQPIGERVDEVGVVRTHECEGLGREIDRADAEALAHDLKKRAIRELEEAIAVQEAYEPVNADGEVVVFDSEGAKRPDGRPR